MRTSVVIIPVKVRIQHVDTKAKAKAIKTLRGDFTSFGVSEHKNGRETTFDAKVVNCGYTEHVVRG